MTVRRKRGRRYGWRKEGAMRETLMVRMKDDQLRFILALARRRKVSLSEAIRVCIELSILRQVELE